MATKTECDLLVVGSGPAGMSAAINGASEGLRVCMIDGNDYLGGQARESNAIENYAGFPDGVTGVFAAGDVRVGSVKRIASAIGEGATALQMIHQRLG